MSDTPHLNALGNSVSVTLPTDADGYLDMECPESSCTGHFKIKPGTGLDDVEEYTCPYCGHLGSRDTFYHTAQIDYATEETTRQVTNAFGQDIKDMFRGLDSGFIRVKVSVEEESAPPVYPHIPLPHELTCDSCGLEYKLATEAGACPECGASKGEAL